MHSTPPSTVSRAASPVDPARSTGRSHPAGPARPTATMPPLVRITTALTGAVLVGVATSFGQAVPAIASLSNAAGPWFVVAVLLVLAAGVGRLRVGGTRPGRPRLRTAAAMVLGVVLLELMHIGYWAATNLRGYVDSLSWTNPWVVLALPAGLLAGAVAVAVRSVDGRWRGAAAGVTAAVLVGEGVRALLQVADTTGTVPWVVEIVVGIAVLVAGVVVARTPVGRVLALGTGVVGTAGVLAVYLAFGAIGAS